MKTMKVEVTCSFKDGMRQEEGQERRVGNNLKVDRYIQIGGRPMVTKFSWID
jgi:hypothetical protein